MGKAGHAELIGKYYRSANSQITGIQRPPHNSIPIRGYDSGILDWAFQSAVSNSESHFYISAHSMIQESPTPKDVS